MCYEVRAGARIECRLLISNVELIHLLTNLYLSICRAPCCLPSLHDLSPPLHPEFSLTLQMRTLKWREIRVL